MAAPPSPSPSPVQRRIAEELAEAGVELQGSDAWRSLLLGEIDAALRPQLHERRVFSLGSIIDPTTDEATWEPGTELVMRRGPLEALPVPDARRFADGMSSWLLRRADGPQEWVVFDRPAGSERDLVVVAEVLGATVVQRHPTGVVRVVGAFGVVRGDGLRWHREPPISSWLDAVVSSVRGDPEVIELLLEFAVHDLGARGIGAILVHRTDDERSGPNVEARLPRPPPLRVRRAADLAPLRHALGQVDGAAVLDADGVLRQIGVRLVPSPDAEASVDGLRGMRHTAGRRYSFDDPTATVIVVSEDGPVTVLRGGELVATSPSAGDGERTFV